MTEAETEVMPSEDGERATSREVQVVTRRWKRQGNGFSLEPPEGTSETDSGLWPEL